MEKCDLCRNSEVYEKFNRGDYQFKFCKTCYFAYAGRENVENKKYLLKKFEALPNDEIKKNINEKLKIYDVVNGNETQIQNNKDIQLLIGALLFIGLIILIIFIASTGENSYDVDINGMLRKDPSSWTAKERRFFNDYIEWEEKN